MIPVLTAGAEPYLFDGWALVVAIVSVASLGTLEVRQAFRTRGTIMSPHDRGSYWIWQATIGFTFPAAVSTHWIVPGLSVSSGGAWPYVAGVAVFWAGIAIRWWGIRTLGRFFQFTVVRSEGQHIVDKGPYAFVRHPGYTGGLLIFLGLGLAVDNLAGLALATALSVAATLYRVKVEEEFLVAEFGDEYREFMRTRKRFVPAVW